jgi:hypothetical protein
VSPQQGQQPRSSWTRSSTEQRGQEASITPAMARSASWTSRFSNATRLSCGLRRRCGCRPPNWLGHARARGDECRSAAPLRACAHPRSSQRQPLSPTRIVALARTIRASGHCPDTPGNYVSKTVRASAHLGCGHPNTGGEYGIARPSCHPPDLRATALIDHLTTRLRLVK